MTDQTVAQVFNSPVEKLANQLRAAALGCLSRREYSRAELAAKLTARFTPDQVTLTIVLDRLENENLQSDLRFSETLINSRIQRGKGLRRIWQELNQKGVTEPVIETALAEASVDWFDLARRTADKKFGCKPPIDWNERGRRSRFLQYRGFSSDEIQYAIR